MKRKILFYSTGIIFLFLFAGWLSLSTPGNPDREKTVIKTGRVTDIVGDINTGDIAIRLDNENNYLYYINRGIQQRLTIDSMKAVLMNKEVQLAYHNDGVKFLREWTKGKHIYEIKQKDNIIYSEF